MLPLADTEAVQQLRVPPVQLKPAWFTQGAPELRGFWALGFGVL